MRRLGLIAIVVPLMAGCAVDTELGFEVLVQDASVAVRSEAEGDVVSITMGVDYRVGTYVQESHELMPQAIDVFVDDALVVTMSPNRPPGFVPRVNPGQSFSVTFTGESRPGVATDARRLCGAEARILFRWVDATTGEIGMSEGTTGPGACD